MGTPSRLAAPAEELAGAHARDGPSVIRTRLENLSGMRSVPVRKISPGNPTSHQRALREREWARYFVQIRQEALRPRFLIAFATDARMLADDLIDLDCSVSQTRYLPQLPSAVAKAALHVACERRRAEASDACWSWIFSTSSTHGPEFAVVGLEVCVGLSVCL